LQQRVEQLTKVQQMPVETLFSVNLLRENVNLGENTHQSTHKMTLRDRLDRERSVYLGGMAIFCMSSSPKRAPVGVSQMFVLAPRALDHNEYQGQGPRYMSWSIGAKCVEGAMKRGRSKNENRSTWEEGGGLVVHIA
jgi:hypothetical protein